MGGISREVDRESVDKTIDPVTNTGSSKIDEFGDLLNLLYLEL